MKAEKYLLKLYEEHKPKRIDEGNGYWRWDKFCKADHYVSGYEYEADFPCSLYVEIARVLNLELIEIIKDNPKPVQSNGTFNSYYEHMVDFALRAVPRIEITATEGGTVTFKRIYDAD